MLERIMGNADTVAALRAAMQNNRLPHALLFVGETGCGAGFAARCLVADTLFPGNGPAAEALVRGETSVAVKAEGGSKVGRIHAGRVREAVALRGEGAKGEIAVSAVRALRAEMFDTGLSADGRAAIIYRAQHLNQSSANALLKIIEEPPENSRFIFTAPTAAAVLPTIRSRCAIYTFTPVSPEDCAAYVRQQVPDCPDALLAARVAGGCIGEAVRLAEQPARQKALADALALAEYAAKRQLYQALVVLAGYEKDRETAAAFLRDFCRLCTAGLSAPGLCALQGQQAAACARHAADAVADIEAFVNVKIVLTDFGTLLCGL